MTTDVMENGSNDPVVQSQGVENNIQQTQASSHSMDDYVPKRRVEELIQERTRQASANAYERAMKEAEKKFSAQGIGGMQSIDDSKLRSMMADVYKEQHQQFAKKYEEQETHRRLQSIADSYMSKLESAKDEYPDIQKDYESLRDLANLVPFLNESDEAAGITDHLLKNNNALINLLITQQHRSPEALRREINKISQSIKQNKTARNREYPDEPLGHITPSIYTENDSSGSIEALKNQDWLRG